jgi:hypothetical protein
VFLDFITNLILFICLNSWLLHGRKAIMGIMKELFAAGSGEVKADGDEGLWQWRKSKQ